MSLCFPRCVRAPGTATAVMLAISCAASAQDPFGSSAPADAGPGASTPVLEESTEHESPRLKSTDADVLAALEMPVTLKFDETPLADVADYLRDQTHINIDVDARDLEDVGLGLDTPVSLTVRRMRLKSAIVHMLEQLDLMYTVRDGALVISTPEALEDELIVRTYPVADLTMDDPLGADGAEFDSLIENIEWMIGPTEWESVGGHGSIAAGAGSLVVNQTFEIHAQIGHYLSALRRARKIATRHADRAPPIKSVWATDGKDKEIRTALNREIPLKFVETPLAKVVDYLREATGVNILINTRALEDVGIGDDTPITRNVKSITLAAGLSLTLSELDLTWEIRDDALVITTPEEAESKLHIRVYPVLDLVRLEEADGGPVLDEEANDYDTLICLITSMVRPTTWDEVGGPASVGAAGFGCLAISQTIDVFEELDAFLASYRQVLAQYREHPNEVFTAAVAVDDALHGKLRRALKQQVGKIDFRDTPLADFAHTLTKRHDVPIQIDHRCLEDVGLSADTAIVTARLGNEPLRDALGRALKPHGLTWVLRDEVILITTKEEADCTLVVKFYPVRDLIERADDLDDLAAGDRRVELFVTITSRLASDDWEDSGGLGVLEMPPDPVLIVSQTEDIHESLAALLASLRKTQQKQQAERDQAEVHSDDIARPLVNSKGEMLYLKNYELHEVSSEETAELAEMVRSLVETSTWDAKDGYSIRPSMTGATIIVRHTTATHRKIHRLLNELGVIEGNGVGGGLGFGVTAVSRIVSLSLSARHADNSLDKGVVLRIVRLDPDMSHSPGQLADEIRKQVEPESWANSTVYLHPFRQQLVVRHTLTSQRKIYRLVDNKDALLKPPQVLGGIF